MMGTVTDDGIPIMLLPIAGEVWRGIIDTGFNGELELPERLQAVVNARWIGRMTALLASGQRSEEDLYLVDFPFDGQIVQAEATFVSGSEILIGTQLLRQYRLEIHFPDRTVRLERV